MYLQFLNIKNKSSINQLRNDHRLKYLPKSGFEITKINKLPKDRWQNDHNPFETLTVLLSSPESNMHLISIKILA